MLNTDREILDVSHEASSAMLRPTTRRTQTGFELTMLTHDRLAFSLEEYIRRYDEIQIAMDTMCLDALLIRGPHNITYFLGYESPGYYKYHCVIVPKRGQPIFIVRSFEWINTPEFSWSPKFVKILDWDHPPSVTANILKQLDLGENKRIGVEKQCFFYTVDEHETLSKECPTNSYIDASRILWDTRMIKSSEEVAYIRRSAELVDIGMQAGFEATEPGVTANAINAVVMKTILKNDGEYMGLPPFVLAGERSCLPHQTGGSNVLNDNDVMYFELCAHQRRYTAALMRTIFVGRIKDEWKRVAEACINATEAALQFIRAGVTSHEADTVAREVTTRAGFGDYHRARLGYSIGIGYAPDWGEGEIISLRQDERRELQPGMTFHMPLLCLKYREFGIGFSESILVTDTGCERLSKLPLEIIAK